MNTTTHDITPETNLISGTPRLLTNSQALKEVISHRNKFVSFWANPLLIVFLIVFLAASNLIELPQQIDTEVSIQSYDARESTLLLTFDLPARAAFSEGKSFTLMFQINGSEYRHKLLTMSSTREDGKTMLVAKASQLDPRSIAPLINKTIKATIIINESTLFQLISEDFKSSILHQKAP